MADALPRLDDTYTGLTPTSLNLCGVRLDNALSLGQTSCFYDVILVPLASWIFLLEVFIWFLPIVLLRARRAGWNPTSTLQRYDYGKRSDVRPWISGWGKTCTFLSSLYVALIGASLAMTVLEIVRLALVQPSRGIGLLPFSTATILLILIVIHIPLPSHIRWCTSLLTLTFWIPMMIFTAVKLHNLIRLEDAEPRTGSEYLASDEIIDVATSQGLYGLFVIVEVVRTIDAYMELRRGTMGGSSRGNQDVRRDSEAVELRPQGSNSKTS